MRRADKRIAQMLRYRRGGDRAIRKAERRLEKARHRYTDARRRVRSTKDDLRLARLDLARATHVRPDPAGQQVGRRAGPRRDVRKLQRELRRDRRRAQRLDDRKDAARREKRLRLRAVGKSRRSLGDVVVRRERAESLLGYRIASMIQLAQHKAEARSMAHPARSGFRRPARGRVSQHFGCTGYRREPRRGGCRHFHDGIDIAGRSGSRIRAAAPGVVAYAGWNPWDGERRAYIVIVAHRGGFQTVYGHLRPVRKARVGKTVRRGQVIGFMGSTGNSTGPHLHWEVRKGTTALDPRRYR
jgi:murein DD-endopeptidase MepM/ murein hydrolase activator NlpD